MQILMWGEIQRVNVLEEQILSLHNILTGNLKLGGRW